MLKRFLTVFLVLAVALSFMACNGEPPNGEPPVEEAEGESSELPSAQEIADGAMAAQDNIETLQLDMDMTMDMSGEAEGESFESTIEMDFSGALDLENQEMAMDIAMNMTVPGEEEMEMQMAIYITGDTMYMMMEMPIMGMEEPMWMKSEVPEGTWAEMSGQMNQVQPVLEMLGTAQVEVTGSEMVGGIDCYVIELTPDMEQLWQLIMQQAESAGEGMLPPVAQEMLPEIIRTFSVKMWIAKDTYFLAKAEIAITMELTPEAMGSLEEEGQINMDIVMVLLADNYNQPVHIVLPPEAEEAEEIPLER